MSQSDDKIGHIGNVIKQMSEKATKVTKNVYTPSEYYEHTYNELLADLAAAEDKIKTLEQNIEFWIRECTYYKKMYYDK